MLQRAAINSSPNHEVPSLVFDVLQSPGQSLDIHTRAFMEPRFQHEFGDVRVHTDAKAAESARAVNALAYTVGRDIVFGEGQYLPHTVSGQKLLAHELTHVVQQGNRTAIQRQTSVAPPDDPAELEAQRIASRINNHQDTQPVHSTAYSMLRQRDISQPQATPRQVRESPTAPAQTRTEDIKIVVKSYIAPIGASIGTPTCSLTYPVPVPVPLPIPGSPITPAPVPTTPAMRLRALAAATDLMMSENPMADTKDKHYRLYSERTFSVTWMGNQLINVVPHQLDTDSGKEGPFQAPPLTVLGISARRSGNSTFDFSWAVRGRPHPAVEPPFQLVCPRTSIYIWHVIQGQIDCSGSRIRAPATIVGSQFPSHRVFVRGTAQHTIPQGPFRNLWIPSSADPTQVR
jgi:hypothetical protein